MVSLRAQTCLSSTIKVPLHGVITVPFFGPQGRWRPRPSAGSFKKLFKARLLLHLEPEIIEVDRAGIARCAVTVNTQAELMHVFERCL